MSDPMPDAPARRSRTLLDAAPGPRSRADSPLPRIQADPRSKILVLLVCNVLVMGVAPTRAVGLIALVVGVLIALDEPVRVLTLYTLIYELYVENVCKAATAQRLLLLCF